MSDRELLEFLWKNRRKNTALLVVAKSIGHAPGKTGFKMAVTETEIFGTIGGGAIEKNLVDIARRMLQDHEWNARIIEQIHDGGKSKHSSGMICGGKQTVVLYPIYPGFETIYGEIREAIDCFNTSYTVLNIFPQGLSFRNAKEGVLGISFTDNGLFWNYREVMGIKDTAFIFGGGHVCQALVPILKSLDFRIIVLDDRQGIAAQNANADSLRIGPFTSTPDLVEEGGDSYVFIMTAGHVSDETVLRNLVGKNLRYIGMMASSKKAEEILLRLHSEGITKQALMKVHSPIGISIKSRTPAEIAISIAAEVIRVRNT